MIRFLKSTEQETGAYSSCEKTTADVALGTHKSKKLILPAAVDTAKIPLSSNTISRRIDDIDCRRHNQKRFM